MTYDTIPYHTVYRTVAVSYLRVSISYFRAKALAVGNKPAVADAYKASDIVDEVRGVGNDDRIRKCISHSLQES